LRLSSRPNKKLLQGFKTQLDEYNKAEGAYASFFVVIDVGTGGPWLDNLMKARNDAKQVSKKVPEVIVVDGKPKPSASKM
jgi:hypothetical protein